MVKSFVVCLDLWLVSRGRDRDVFALSNATRQAVLVRTLPADATSVAETLGTLGAITPQRGVRCAALTAGHGNWSREPHDDAIVRGRLRTYGCHVFCLGCGRDAWHAGRTGSANVLHTNAHVAFYAWSPLRKNSGIAE